MALEGSVVEARMLASGAIVTELGASKSVGDARIIGAFVLPEHRNVLPSLQASPERSPVMYAVPSSATEKSSAYT